MSCFRRIYYYPFGMEMEGPWELSVSAPENSYGYNTKELNDDFGLDWSDYGARWYDPSIGRWNVVDEFSDLKHNRPLTPYHFVANNPISNIDPDGLDWYRNNDTGEVHWQKGSDDVDGHTNIGAYYIHEGADNYVVHYQNEVIGVVSKEDGGDAETAYTRQIEHMTVERPFKDQSRLVEALLQMPSLISEALLTYAPGVKGAKTKGKFSPKFVKHFVQTILKNPKSLLGKSAKNIADAFIKMGYKVRINPMRSGRGHVVIIEGHSSINAIKVHTGGGRHALPSVQIKGQQNSKKLSIKVVKGPRSQYKGNIAEEEAAGTKFIFAQ